MMEFAKLLEAYNTIQRNKSGIEPNSYIDESATLGSNIYVGAFAYLGKNVKIGENTKIYPNCYVGDNCIIGNNTTLFPGVKVYSDCVIGNHVTLHSGVVIGADGFGFAGETYNSRAYDVAQECILSLKNKIPIPFFHKQRSVVLPPVAALLLKETPKIEILDFGGGLGIGYMTLKESILYANEMNLYHSLDKDMQYSFYLNTIRKRKRYSPWLRKDKIKDLECVKQYYSYSNEKAYQALKILSKEQLDFIKQRLEIGGTK